MTAGQMDLKAKTPVSVDMTSYVRLSYLMAW